MTQVARYFLAVSFCVLPPTTRADSAEPVDYVILGSSAARLTEATQKLRDAGGEVIQQLPQIGVTVIRSQDAKFLEQVSQIKGISAVPDVEVQWSPPVPTLELSEDDLVDIDPYADPPLNDVDDLLAPFQWGLDAVDAPEAWELGATGAGVRVAVLDSGIVHWHVDIAPNFNAAASASFVPGEPFQRTRPGFSHATHVAGIIAAANNGRGTVGVAPNAEIIGVKVLRDATGSGNFSWILGGIIHAADVEADIINMSLGGSFARRGEFFDPGTPDDKNDDIRTTPFLAHLHAAFNRATTYAHQRGVTIIASAGNSGTDGEQDKDRLVLPRDAAHVISISATAPEGWALDFSTDLDVPASYSDFGTSVVDFSAPGGDSDLPIDDRCTVLFINLPCWVFDRVLAPSTVRRSSNVWAWAQGTSMAAPHAAGVAALVIGQAGGDLHPSQVEAILRAGAADINKPGKDDSFGHGRVNALYSAWLATP